MTSKTDSPAETPAAPESNAPESDETIVGRFTFDEIKKYAEFEADSASWALIVRTLDDEEAAAINLARSAIQNARTLESVKDLFVKDYDDASAVQFLDACNEFSEAFVSLAKSAVVKVQGRGKETKQRWGVVSFNPDGEARVSMLAIPCADGSTLKVLVERPSTESATVAEGSDK